MCVTVSTFTSLCVSLYVTMCAGRMDEGSDHPRNVGLSKEIFLLPVTWQILSNADLEAFTI